jgi:hypothetical protein
MTHTQSRRWVELDETPILLANAFLIQHEPHEFVLTVGQATGPLVGTPDVLDESGPTPIHAMARFGLTRERAQELVSILQAKLEEHDRMVGVS